jgi:hypothetical protein
MDESNAASKSRFEQALKDANWNAQVNGASNNPIALWLYSVNPVQGARLITQMSADGFRVACEQPALPFMLGMKPWDVLGGFLDEYDRLESFEARASMSDDLAKALVIYATSTRTWSALPSPHQAPGIHLVICDWSTQAGTRVFKPCVRITGKVLSPEELSMTLSVALDAHVSKHPSEAPVLV